jgi:hypothetical protein
MMLLLKKVVVFVDVQVKKVHCPDAGFRQVRLRLLSGPGVSSMENDAWGG